MSYGPIRFIFTCAEQWTYIVATSGPMRLLTRSKACPCIHHMLQYGLDLLPPLQLGHFSLRKSPHKKLKHVPLMQHFIWASWRIWSFQQLGCLATTFQQDGALPHISRPAQQILRCYFTECTISHAFPRRWPPRSLDLTPCDFWLWGYLTSKVDRGNIRNLADLNYTTTLYIHNITPAQLRTPVEHTVSYYQLLLVKQSDTLKTTYESIVYYMYMSFICVINDTTAESTACKQQTIIKIHYLLQWIFFSLLVESYYIFLTSNWSQCLIFT